MHRRLKYIFCVALLIIFSLGAVNAAEVTVKGHGLSRDQAVRDALRAAVEQAVGTLVSSEVLTQNYTLVSDNIYSNSRGFIRNYDIIHEETRDGMVIVTVRVNVDTESNSKLLSELEQLNLVDVLGNPKIAVIIPEYHVSSPIPDPAGETAVLKKLIDAGFTRVVDVERVQSVRYTGRLKSAFEGNPRQAVAIASDLDKEIDYLIVGEAFSQYAGNLYNSGVLSCRARIEAKLINARTGAIIATDGFYAGGVDIAEFVAAKQALSKAGDMMGEFMVGKLFGLVNKPKNIRLNIKNINSFSKVKTLEQQLLTSQGVKSVSIGTYTPSVTIMTVTFYGTGKNLATVLENLGAVIVEEVTSDTIQSSMKY